MKYIANPVEVEAFKIALVRPDNLTGSIALRLEDGLWVNATKEMVSRMTPAVGDYWVKQSDGYVYLNPKEVFERKYRPA